MARGSVRKRCRSGNGLLLGHARVSKGDDQTNIMQARALRATGCRRIFEEAASGRTGAEMVRISRTSRSKPSNICVGTVMATIQSPHRSARHCRATAI